MRSIAATNVPLEEAVTAGRFREDLFYRLAVARASISPLRERPGDILPLARYFADVYAARLDGGRRTRVPAFTAAAERRLLTHPWMGNIRELENAIHHALLVCHDGCITPDDLPLIAMPRRRAAPASAPSRAPESPAGLPDARLVLRSALRSLYDEGAPQLWDEIEEMVIRTAYEHSGHNQLQTARLLGVSRNVVRARLLQFGMESRRLGGSDAREADLVREERRDGLAAAAGGGSPTATRCSSTGASAHRPRVEGVE